MKGVHGPGPYFDGPGPWTRSMERVHGPGVHVLYFPFVNYKSSVLLQTARANVSKPGNGERFVNARMLFDSDSQRSYIQRTCRKHLTFPSLARTHYQDIRRVYCKVKTM